MDKIGKKQTETDRNGQRRKETGKNWQRLTATERYQVSRVRRQMSSVIPHLNDCPSLQQGWKIHTSLISNYDHDYRQTTDRQTDRQTDIQSFFCPALIQRLKINEIADSNLIVAHTCMSVCL